MFHQRLIDTNISDTFQSESHSTVINRDTPYKKADILFPGYGVQLEEIAHLTKHPEIADPYGIFSENGYNATKFLAAQSLKNGANIATLNQFWTRKLIRESNPVADGVFQEIARLNLQAINAAQSETHKRAKQIVASLGPGAENCYDPEKALNFQEAKNFHGAQSRLILEIDPHLIPWFETFPTIDEAKGAASALNGPGVISFVLNNQGNLRSGEKLRDAIRAVREHNPNIIFGANCFPIETADNTLASLGGLIEYFGIVYPNASSLDPTEFDGSNGETTLGLINPDQTAQYLNYLVQKYNLQIIGGCCGYNYKNIANLSRAVHNRITTHLLPPSDKKNSCDCQSQNCPHFFVQ